MQVGEAFADNKTVTVAKIDATANDVPSDKFSVGHFGNLALLLKIPLNAKISLTSRLEKRCTCSIRFACADEPNAAFEASLSCARLHQHTHSQQVKA